LPASIMPLHSLTSCEGDRIGKMSVWQFTSFMKTDHREENTLNVRTGPRTARIQLRPISTQDTALLLPPKMEAVPP
jgi:hypothetical protein